MHSSVTPSCISKLSSASAKRNEIHGISNFSHVSGSLVIFGSGYDTLYITEWGYVPDISLIAFAFSPMLTKIKKLVNSWRFITNVRLRYRQVDINKNTTDGDHSILSVKCVLGISKHVKYIDRKLLLSDNLVVAGKNVRSSVLYDKKSEEVISRMLSLHHESLVRVVIT